MIVQRKHLQNLIWTWTVTLTACDNGLVGAAGVTRPPLPKTRTNRFWRDADHQKLTRNKLENLIIQNYR